MLITIKEGNYSRDLEGDQFLASVMREDVAGASQEETAGTHKLGNLERVYLQRELCNERCGCWETTTQYMLGLGAAGAVTAPAQRESVLSKVHSKANRDGCTPVEKQQALVRGHNQPEMTSQQDPRRKFPNFFILLPLTLHQGSPWASPAKSQGLRTFHTAHTTS